ncbi:MAG: hypothetical protein RL670_1123, partial [Actinomycetota bacterium]
MEYRGFSAQRLASYVDHTVLAPTATDQDIVAGAAVALELGVAAFCVRPMDVIQARDLLAGSGVRLATVIGFPHGTNTTATKSFEAREALENGAVELDMVMNQGLFLSRYNEAVVADMRAVVELAHARGA